MYIGNTLAQGLISGANIQDGTVDTVDLKDGAVTPAKMSTGHPTWDANGNLGLGVTPSTWSTGKALEVGAVGNSLWGYSSTAYLLQNAYYNSGFKYAASGVAASAFAAQSGGFSWSISTDATKTAGSPITFNQAMTLDASGRLILGGTTYSAAYGYAPLHVTAGAASAAAISVLGRSSDNLGDIYFTSNSGSGGYAAIEGGPSGLSLSGLGATNVVFGTNGSERARIDSNGNVGIGLTPTSGYGRLQVLADGNVFGAGQNRAIEIYDAGSGSGEGGALTFSSLSCPGFAAIWGYTSNPGGSLCFGTNAANTGFVSERMRITTSGQIYVGNTTISASYPGSKFFVYQNVSADYSGVFESAFSTAGNNYGVLVKYSAASPNGSSNEFFSASDSTGQRMTVRSNGGIANYQANNVNLSDRREKTNFAPAKSYLDVICAIPVQTFNYIDQNMEEDAGSTLGVVAQDVQEVAPELVMESNWGTEENPRVRLSIYQTDLQYALMKSIQELNAKVDAQAAEIAALKGQ